MAQQSVTEARYDSFIYPRLSFRQPHPEVMAARAALFGLTPPSLNTFRFLEIGCATGTHLIGLASAYPNATFVGIDLSANQLKIAQDDVAAVGLTNVKFQHASVTDIDESWGKFDFIMTHGVYSWVPPEVQTHILRVCRENLTDNGIAYVSYNCYPGWHVKGIMRDLMVYQSRFAERDQDKLAQGKSILAYLAANAPADQPFTKLLQTEAEFIAKADDHYLLHEHLEEHNAPLYFYQFAERATKQNLKYLGDTELYTMFPVGLNEAAQKQISATPDQVRLEQYLDFVRNTSFRRSLLVRDEQNVSYSANAESLSTMRFAAAFVKKGRYHKTDELVQYQAATGSQQLNISGAVAKNGLEVLAEAWPMSLSLDDWIGRVQQVGAKVGARAFGDDAVRATLLQVAWVAHTHGLLEVRVEPEPYAGPKNLPERPTVSAFARYQAANGQRLVSLRNEMLEGDSSFLFLLQLLDGTRTQQDLEAELSKAIAEGSMKAEPKKPGEKVNVNVAVSEVVSGFWTQMAERAFAYAKPSDG